MGDTSVKFKFKVKESSLNYLEISDDDNETKAVESKKKVEDEEMTQDDDESLFTDDDDDLMETSSDDDFLPVKPPIKKNKSVSVVKSQRQIQIHQENNSNSEIKIKEKIEEITINDDDEDDSDEVEVKKNMTKCDLKLFPIFSGPTPSSSFSVAASSSFKKVQSHQKQKIKQSSKESKSINASVSNNSQNSSSPLDNDNNKKENKEAWKGLLGLMQKNQKSLPPKGFSKRTPTSSLFNNSKKNKLEEDNENIILNGPKPWDQSNPLPFYGNAEIVSLNYIQIDENDKSDKKGNTKKTKQCPFYKKIPGTNFSVDAFNYGIIPEIEIYFLSHFHSDHYVGLTKKFCKTIICSPPTANLVKLKIGVRNECIRSLELNKVYKINDCEIVLLDANHCPGSVMFIFRLPNGTNYFHTGDFRFEPSMLENNIFLDYLRTDVLYLDTTYCDPKYDFPRQCSTINQTNLQIKMHLTQFPKTLIVCGTYLIGKERVFISLAKEIGTKVFCQPDKFKILTALENEEFSKFLTENESEARIHVLSMMNLGPDFLSEYISKRLPQYNNIYAIRPSGWTFSSKKANNNDSSPSVRTYFNGTVRVLGIPYSEHSSFSELRDFVTALNPVKIQPTVNVGKPESRDKMNEFFKEWLKK